MYLNGISNNAFLSSDILNYITDILNWIADISKSYTALISVIELQTSLKSANQTVFINHLILSKKACPEYFAKFVVNIGIFCLSKPREENAIGNISSLTVYWINHYILHQVAHIDHCAPRGHF